MTFGLCVHAAAVWKTGCLTQQVLTQTPVILVTFAAIAMSGDVNINAIAPGIAGALMATVAGLGVAIPALFGYNWLTLRIKDLTSDMQVFVDEFTTKMAEVYSSDRPGPAVHRMAAE